MFIRHHSIVRSKTAVTTVVGCIALSVIPFELTAYAAPPVDDRSIARASLPDLRSNHSASPSSGTQNRVQFEPPSDGDDAPPGGSSGGGRGGSRDLDDVAVQEGSSWEFVPPGRTESSTFEPPDDETPPDSVGGGSRDLEEQPVPLLPQGDYGQTLSPRPEFFLYLPATTARQVFFSLHTVDRQTHYEAYLPISGEAGILRVSLPDDAPALEPGQTYQWHIVAFSGDRLRPDSPSASGWVRRVVPDDALAEQSEAANSDLELAVIYGSHGLWYDTVARLAALRQTEPHSNALAAEWRDLLSQVGLSDLADRPLLLSP